MAMPYVGLRPASSAWSKGKGTDVASSPVSERPAAVSLLLIGALTVDDTGN
jgi:hypothetical protein